MAQIVETPIGVVEFPDDMTPDAIEQVLRKEVPEVEGTQELQLTRRALGVVPLVGKGFAIANAAARADNIPDLTEAPEVVAPRSPEELAQANIAARQQLGLPERLTARPPVGLIEPAIPLPRVQSTEEAVVDTGPIGIGSRGVRIPKTGITPPAAALANKAIEFAEFAESPVGVATGVVGKIGSPLVKALVSTAYGADMLRKLPSAAKALEQAGETGTEQEVWEAWLNLGTSTLLGTSLGRHGIGGLSREAAKLLPRTAAEVAKTPTAEVAAQTPPEVPVPDFTKLPKVESPSPLEREAKWQEHEQEVRDMLGLPKKAEPVPPPPAEAPLTSAAPAPTVPPVKTETLEKGMAIEAHDHPTLTAIPGAIEQVAKDELRLDPEAYKGEKAPKPSVPVPAQTGVGSVPIASQMIETARESVDQLRNEVSMVRYGRPGEILFEFKGKTYSAPEPIDVMPAQDATGTNAEASRSWALKQVLDGKAKPISAPAPIAPIVGMRFFHKHIYDPTLMPEKVPQMFEVSAIRQGRIYYRPVYRYEGGRIALGKAKDYTTPERWEKIFGREATAEEAAYGKTIPAGISAPAAPVEPTPTTAGEPLAAGAVKEPWQMTRAEVHSGVWDVNIPGGSKPGEHTLNLEIAHRAAIRKALAEGKPVPPAVLADYPDLAPKPAAAPAEPTQAARYVIRYTNTQTGKTALGKIPYASKESAEKAIIPLAKEAQKVGRPVKHDVVIEGTEPTQPAAAAATERTENAIQERSTKALPVGEAPADSGAVGARVPEPGQAAHAQKPEQLPPREAPGRDVAPKAAPQVPLAEKGKAETPESYVKSLRNSEKRRYAGEYLRWLRGGESGDAPKTGQLSYMAAQGVRLHLDKLLQSKPAAAPTKPAPPPPAPAVPAGAPAQMQAEVTKTVEAPAAKADAIKQSKTITAKLRAQREYLVAAVEGAIRKAPDNIADEQRASILAEDRNRIDAIEKEFAGKAGELQTTLGYSWYETDEGKALLAEREAAFEPLFSKYGIVKDYPASTPYMRLDQTVASEREAGQYALGTREEMLKAAVKRAVEDQLPHILIQVPGDGDFTIINTKSALKSFLETVKKDFPTSAPRGPIARTGALGAKPIAATPTKVTTEDALKAIQTHLSTDETRYTLQYAYSNGSELVATDGRRLIRVIGDFGGTESNPIWYKEGKADSTKGKTERFPNYGQIIPAETWILKGGQDTAELIRLVRLAKSATSETSNSVKLWRNTDGTLGVTAVSPDSAEYAGNIKDGANVIAAFNPDYLLEGLEASRRLGNEKVDLYSSSHNDVELSPMVIRGKSHEIILMPMRLEGTPAGVKPGMDDVVKAAQRDKPVHPNNLPAAKSPAEPTQPILSEGSKFAVGPYYRIELNPDEIKISHRSGQAGDWTEETIDRKVWPTGKDEQIAAARSALGWQRELEPADLKIANRQADVLVRQIGALIKKDAANAKKAAAKTKAVAPSGPGIIGMGGAVPEEFGEPGDFVSNMFAAIAREREAMGKSPMPDVKGRAWDEDNKIALARMNRDPNWIPDLIKSVTAKPRPLLSWEMAGMVWQKAHWKAEANNALVRIARAFDDNRKADLTEAQQDVARFEDNLAALEKAVFRGGTGSEAGRTLQAQKMAAGEDFTLVEMRLQKRFAANKGAPLTPAQEAEVAKAYADLEAARKAAAAAEVRAQEAEAARVLAELKAKSVPTFDKRVLDYAEGLVRKMETAGDAAMKRLQAKLAQPGAWSGLDPTILDDFAIWGSAKIARLGLDSARFADALVREFSEKVRPYVDEIWAAANKRLEAQLSKAPPQVRAAIKQKAELPPLEAAKQSLIAKAKSKLNADVTYQVRKFCRALIAENPDINRDELIAAVHKVLQDAVPDITRRDVLKAISGYGEFKQLTKDEISVILRDLKGQIQQVAKLEDMAARTPPEKTGIERREPTDEERRLIKLVNEAKVMGGYKVTDPATQLKSALQTFKTRTRNAIVDLERRLAEHDFAEKPRRPLELDPEALSLQADYRRLKKRWEEELRKDELAKRKGWQKALAAFVKWERAFKLSSPIVFGKLTAAAITRIHATTAEELVGTVLSRLPAIRGVAEQSPREGAINVPAMAKAFRLGISQGINDAWATARKGAADIDVMYGDKLLDKDWANFFGQLHGMMKAPIKRMEFEYSLQKRIEHAIRNGYDATDPLVQARLCAEALNDGYRSIFMQHGFSADMFNLLVNSMEKSAKYQPIGEVSARLARFLFPIVRVPFNIVSETATGVYGVPVASTRLMLRAMKDGLKDLPPDTADSIMRQFKKGSIGLGLMAIGYFSPNFAGGYDWREKRKPGQAKPFQFRIFDYDVPKWVTHAPWFELMQIGATMRRVKEQHVPRTSEDKGIEEGMWAAGLGLIEQTPFIDQIGRLDRVFESESARNLYLGQLARSTIIPQAMTKVAEWTDVDLPEGRKRKPKTFWQHLQMGIPGARQNVPIVIPPNPLAPKQPSLKPAAPRQRP